MSEGEWVSECAKGSGWSMNASDTAPLRAASSTRALTICIVLGSTNVYDKLIICT